MTMDHSKYSYTRKCVNGSPWYLDLRHTEILYRLALASPPSSVLAEIGSFCGASTSGFVSAMLKREDLRLRIFEPQVQPELLRVIEPVCGRVDLYAHATTAEALRGSTIVFIDGDHKAGALSDLAACLSAGCLVIALHDTHGTGPKSRKVAWGSIQAAGDVKHVAGRHWWEDHERREGEYTDRGFLVSWMVEDGWVVPCIPEWTPAKTDLLLRSLL